MLFHYVANVSLTTNLPQKNYTIVFVLASGSVSKDKIAFYFRFFSFLHFDYFN